VSLLAGRIFFKDLRYHGTNETILIHGGHVTWRYWLRKVREVDCRPIRAGADSQSFGTKDADVKAARSNNTSDGETGGAAKKMGDLPCRIALSARGLEWFVYNRTPAYDAIVASMSSVETGASSGLKDANGSGSPSIAQKDSIGNLHRSRETLGHSVKSEVRSHTNNKPVSEVDKSHPIMRLQNEPPSFQSEEVTQSADVRSSTAGNARHQPMDRGQDESPSVSNILAFLPIYVECSKGGIVLGNENTRTLLTAKFERASGHVDATHSRAVDQFKQLINFDFIRPLVQMRTNSEYQQSQLSAAAQSKGEGHNDTKTTMQRRHNLSRHSRGFGKALKDLIRYFRIIYASSTSSQNSQEPSPRPARQDTQRAEDRWLGLSRYLREIEQDEQDSWRSVEYAKMSTILDCPSVGMSFYWDIPGVVTERSPNDSFLAPEYRDDINGDVPPDWGIDLRIRGGDIHYGPWTDRERADLQTIFLPNSYRDAVPPTTLRAGQPRVSTVFRLRVDIEEAITIRIPFREESKDWKWKGKANVVRGTEEQNKQREKRRWGIGRKGNKGGPGPEVRPFGWLDIKMEPDSAITYTMDMLPRATGFKNELRIDLRGTEVSSSVNHGLLWRSTSQTISCDLSNPLEWNALHQWNFNIVSNNLELFILRDHIFLLTDLISDWTSGSAADFYTFVPFQYRAKLVFPNFKLYLNANDSNIINNPSDLDDNTFITVWGENMVVDVDVPLKRYQSSQNVVGFDVNAQNGGFELRTPLWNTQNTFLDNKDIVSLEALCIKGSYDYYTTNSPSQTDTLLLDLYGSKLTAHLYGFFVRCLMRLKDNYFGDDLHFRTLEEFQSLLLNQGLPNQTNRENVESKSRKNTNDLDVILSVTIEDTSALLPANLYSAEESIRLDLADVVAEMRFTNYYMDLEVNLSPLLVSLESPESGKGLDNATSSTQVFIDGVDVYGHRLFGLPPAEPTYVCNWDFRVGAIDGECSTDFVRTVSLALQCFAFSFSDNENALPSIHAKSIHDVTFLRADIEPICVWLLVDQAAILVSFDTLSFSFNDWGQMDYSETLNLVIPELTLACIDAKSALRHQSKTLSPVTTLAYLRTSVKFSMIERKEESKGYRELQQNHLRMHDQRTRRTEWLLHTKDEQAASILPGIYSKADAPAMPVPHIPEPAALERGATIRPPSVSSYSSSIAPRYPANRNRSTSSFLSLRDIYDTRNSDKSQSKRDESRPSGSEKNTTTRVMTVDKPLGSTARWTSACRSDHAMEAERLPRQGRVENGGQLRNELGPSSSSFTRSFVAPHFSLCGVTLNLQDVPDLPDCVTSYRDLARSALPPDDGSIRDEDSGAMRTSFIVTFDSGLIAYASPEALYSISALLGHLQPRDPASVLDSLQVDVMSEILGSAKKRPRDGKTTEVTFRVSYAHVRFVNPLTLVEDIQGEESQDRYNFISSRCAMTARTTAQNHNEDGGNNSTVHLAMGSLSFVMEEPLSAASSKFDAVRGDIGDVDFWLVSDPSISGNLRVKTFAAITFSKNIVYLATLTRRTNALGLSVARSFEILKEQQKMRLRHLAFALTMLGASLPDPPLFTRPSYVLRSAPGHIRVNDSWRIITRFRCMFQGLAEHQKAELVIQCKKNGGHCPGDAAARVSKSFDGWRSWELSQVRKSLVIQSLFGAMPRAAKSNFSKYFAITAVATVGTLRLAIDPGPKQNELNLNALAICTTTKATSIPAIDLTSNSSTAYMTVVQVHCMKIGIDLHWECWELFQDAQKLFLASEGHGHTSPVPSSRSTAPSMRTQHYHVLLSADTGKVTIDSFNLSLLSRCDGVDSSFVTADYPGLRKRRAVNIVVHADVASSELISHTKTLAILQARQPRICASHTEDSGGDASPADWTLTGLWQGVLCNILADLPSLVGVVDLLINDEIPYVRRVVTTLKDRPAAKKPTIASSNAKPKRVIIVLSLDEYQIQLAVLPSLVYTITGSVARSSMAVKPHGNIVVDVDLKGQSHSLETEVDGRTRKVSVLNVPPINGYINSISSEVSRLLKVSIAVEPIGLDASALHSLLDILRSAETATVIEDMCHDFKGIKSRLQGVSEPTQHTELTESSDTLKPIFYNAHITLAEIKIRAVAPVGSTGETAQMDLSFDCVGMEATNRSGLDDGVLEYPELSMGVRNAQLVLKRFDDLNTQRCGRISLALSLNCTSKQTGTSHNVRAYQIKARDVNTVLVPDTASTVVDVFGYMQDKVKCLALSERLSYKREQKAIALPAAGSVEPKHESGKLFSSMYSLEVLDIQISWAVEDGSTISTSRDSEDLVLSITKIDLATKKDNAARLVIEDFQLQMVPAEQNRRTRSLNSALLPEVVFNVAYLSTKDDRRLAFQAAGKSLDLRLTSQFVIPASNLQRSIASASQKFRSATAKWAANHIRSDIGSKKLLGNKRLASLLVDADFAGAVVYIQGRKVADARTQALNVPNGGRMPQHGRYGQFTHEDASSSTTLRAPGIALKVEYNDNGSNDPSLNAEIKVDASSNKLYPTVVPLIMEISSSIKNVVGEPEDIDISSSSKTSSQKFLDEDKLRAATPSAILGKCKLNVGLQIRRQEFSLSCQPIARVAAIARLEDIYFTVNTVQSSEHSRFFAVSATFSKLQASLQHVYSRESTASFDVESIVVSLMNSRHVSDASGISAILRVSPMTAQINAKQLQDYLLFREIWIPADIRQSPVKTTPRSVSESQTYTVQRYQHVASAGAFPWDATISIAELNIQLDMGQALGKSAFTVSDFWISTKKTSDWEQNLCLGFQEFAVNSSGRMSGFVGLQNCRIRTYIRWPLEEKAVNQAPLVQASIGFDGLKVKAAFEYQAFLITDISTFEFFMYNVRKTKSSNGDRLVGILDGGKVQVFCTSTSASQGLALYQAFKRLAQEKRTAYESSLKDIEKHLRRKSTVTPAGPRLSLSQPARVDAESTKTPISLHTDVMVTLRAVNIGMFPSTFLDNQVFKFEALNAEANFAVVLENDRVHSRLGLTLGQLRIALSSVRQSNAAKSPGEVAVDDVVSSATGSRGGTILKVPRVVANMETWQTPESNHIDYKFISSFEGKVDVGWNYSRIRFIRTMWASHSRSLAQRLGKPLRQSAVQISGGPLPEVNGEGEEGLAAGAGQEKITAVVNVPQSKYDYTALEAPIIETPQLRDMGEATPPLEWIGLQRDRLPHLTHQLIIVTLLEVAKEVEDAYCKILGSS